MTMARDGGVYRNDSYAWNRLFRKYILPNEKNLVGSFLLWGVGIPELEREYNRSPGDWFFASYDDLVAATGIQRNIIGKYLRRLSSLRLVEFVPGKGKTQTRIRRIKPCQPAQAGNCAQSVNAPQHGIELAALLNSRAFRYGNKEVKPTWRAGIWGQVTSREPNIQGDKEYDRWRRLRAGLQNGWSLAYLDIKAAEPTILKEELKRRGLFAPDDWPDDPHSALAGILNMERHKVKKWLNALPYRKKDCVVEVQQWGLPSGSIFIGYAEALDELREQLWQEGKPIRDKNIRRHVRTMTGTIVRANAGTKKRNHRGKIVKWFAAGSVSEIVNCCCRRILNAEEAGAVRLLFPIHDGIYVSAKGIEPICHLQLELVNLCQSSWNLSLDFRLTTRASRHTTD